MKYKKPLGISQGSLNLSRNRNHRILEAVIDHSPQNKNTRSSENNFITLFNNKTVGTGSEDVLNPRLKRFYRMYPNYRKMFIGSRK